MQPRSRPEEQEVSLEPARPADAVLLQRWRGEPSVRRFQPLGSASTARLGAEIADQNISDLYRGRGEKYQWIIRVGDQPAGWVTLVVANWDHGLAELGYALSTPFQGRRLMPRVLELLLSDLFQGTRLERIEARCAVDNVASQRVLERVGFTREGRLRGYFVLGRHRVDNWLYAILKQDWLERQTG